MSSKRPHSRRSSLGDFFVAVGSPLAHMDQASKQYYDGVVHMLRIGYEVQATQSLYNSEYPNSIGYDEVRASQ